MNKDSNKFSNVRFLAVMCLNVTVATAEFIGGGLSGSLSLISDAIHNVGDVVATFLAYIGTVFSKKSANKHKTFGYRRANILASYFNTMFLVVIAIFLIMEASNRLIHPAHVNSSLMLWVAMIGMILNSAAALLLRPGAKNSLSIKAIYLCILTDAFSSAGVIAGAIVIKVFHVNFIDPVITIIISFLLLKEAIPMWMQTTNILMQASPNLNYKGIEKDILNIPDILNVHHVHAWMIDENKVMFSLHVNLKDQMLSDSEGIYNKIEKLLEDKYGISHVTIQSEVDRGKQNKFF